MRLRIRSTKIGKVRFTSHRDAARIWERALRRLVLPVAVSEGFTPRPKVSFGLALPTGAESIAEYVDIELRADAGDVDLEALPARLSAVLPRGFEVLVVACRDGEAGSLQESVTSCTWELWSSHLGPDDHVRACRLVDRDELLIERERKGRRGVDDVRPLVLGLRPTSTGDRLIADLATVGRALRPAELAELAYPDIDPRDVRALRTHQWIDHDDGRREVLPLPADVDARTLVVSA
ncbi:MAG: TIGR03936 family radical SAM-associated protein [Ilumatobacteraceae bacterium]